jgi:signal transduction histidine kinase
MSQALKVIHVEDSEDDSFLVEQMLKREGFACEISRVETREQLINALCQPKWNLILSDCTLPRFHGLEALEVARATRPEIPFIFVSGTIGEETAINSLQNGATDYVLKHRLTRLAPAIRRALSEAQGRTAREALETQLVQSQKLEALGTSVGGLAHDFRNLLQVLSMSIELLQMEANDPQVVMELAQRMKKATDQGRGMVEELLHFARKTETRLDPVDIARQIKHTVRTQQSCLPGDIALSLHLDEDLPAVLADAGHIDRILTNLIVNARDALPNGGSIMISTDVIRFDRIPADTWQIKDAPYLRVIVSDTGTGIDEATQARIFEPFFTTKPAGKGTGLGLSVVFGLIEAHHGFIDMESKVGEGTTFSLFFPLPEDATAERVHLIAPIRLLGKTSMTHYGAP